MAADDDDDWGDFVISSTTLSHTLSLPVDTAATPVESASTKSGSAPGRVSSVSVTPFQKPKGALPLSIFGGIEEEEEEVERSGGEGPSSDIKGANLFAHNKTNDAMKDKKDAALGVKVDDLIASLYKQAEPRNGSAIHFERSDPDPRDLDSAVKLNKKEAKMSSNWNWTDQNLNNGNGVNEKKLDFDWNPLNLDRNGVDLGRNDLDSGIKDKNSIGANEGFGVEEEADDGWEFKGAEPENGLYEVSKKTGNGIVPKADEVDSNWRALNTDFSGWNSNVNSGANWSNTGPVPKNRELGNEWAFNDAPSKVPFGDENSKDDQNKMESTPNLDFMESSSGWGVHPDSNIMTSNLSGTNSDGKQLSSDLNGTSNDFDNADGWSFTSVQASEAQVRDENSKGDDIKTQNKPTFNFNVSNSTWNIPNSNGGMMSSDSNGLNMDLKQDNINSPDADSEDEDGWEFKAAESEPWATNGNTEDDGRSVVSSKGNASAFGLGNSTPLPGDFFGVLKGTSHKAGDWDFGLQSSLPQEDNSNDHKQNATNFSPVHSDEMSWAFKDSLMISKDKEEQKEAEVSTTLETSAVDGEIQENKVRFDNHKGALPLSIFGFEEEEGDDPVINQEILSQMPTLKPSDCIKIPQSNISINDLISSLYSQAGPSVSANGTENLVENGLGSTRTVMPSDVANADDDFGDDSWEFKDASSGANAENQASTLEKGMDATKSSTRSEITDHADFFSKLKEELHFVALCHRGNLKKAQSATTEGDAEVQALDKDIEDLDNELRLYGMISGDVLSEDQVARETCLKEFVEVLQEPRFQVLESEYHLSKKLPCVENDLRLTIELLKHVASIIKILTLLSREDQSTYVSAWFKMLSACAQELKHGALIWNQLLQKNLCEEILSKPQGKTYIIALGEIYRVLLVLRSSINLYKPWVLASSIDSRGMLTLIRECSTLWSSAGLEEALNCISDLAGFQYDGGVRSLLESIKHIQSLDTFTLYDHVFSGHKPLCRLSILNAGLVPGMKTVVWNGEYYFLTLANLWANLVSSDPPKLPHIEVGG